MRLWSLHPKYLDSKGLVALWREALLAKAVLEGKTKGYTNHPQLRRFKDSDNSLGYINLYLNEIFNEAKRRGYHFSADKVVIDGHAKTQKLPVTRGQIEYEFQWLQKKLALRDTVKLAENNQIKNIEINEIFHRIDGAIEAWERV